MKLLIKKENDLTVGDLKRFLRTISDDVKLTSLDNPSKSSDLTILSNITEVVYYDNDTDGVSFISEYMRDMLNKKENEKN